MKKFNSIDGFDYFADNIGNIYSTTKYVRTFLRRGVEVVETKKIIKSRKLKQFTQKNGYKHVVLNNNGLKKGFNSHRLVAAAFFGNKSIENKQINHIDFNPSNNNITNLEICTRSENMRHSAKHGRLSYIKMHMRGCKNINNKLSEKDVVYIYKSKKMQKDLAKKFNVSQATISAIKVKKTFGYLTDKL